MNGSSLNTDMNPPRRSRRIWPWVVAAALLVLLAAVVGGLWALQHLADMVRGGVQVVVNGEDWTGWQDWADLARSVLDPGAWQLSLGGVLLALVIIAVVLVVVLPLVVGLVFSAVGLALAVALLAAVVSVAVALSPVLLVALLLWLALRDKPAKAAQPVTPAADAPGTASMAP